MITLRKAKYDILHKIVFEKIHEIYKKDVTLKDSHANFYATLILSAIGICEYKSIKLEFESIAHLGTSGIEFYLKENENTKNCIGKKFKIIATEVDE